MNRLLFVLLIATVALASCSKKTARFSSKTRTAYNVRSFNFEDLQIRSKLEVDYANKPGTQNANALIRLKKDSLIWFNLTGSLGIQGLRGMFTQDSVKILNRVSKEYIAFSYAEFSREFNFKVDFPLLQALLLGNPIYPGQGEPLEEEGQYYLRQVVNDVQIDSYVNREISKLSEVKMREMPTDNRLSILYSEFQQVGAQLFPFAGNVNLQYKDETGSLESKIMIEHTKVEISDKPLKFPFNVPSKYKNKNQ